jgi:hypothetical protein
MKVNVAAQNKILRYVQSYESRTLMFKEYSPKYPRETLVGASVDDLVHRVLYTTAFFPSYNLDTGSWETGSCRNRSSLDIWRHCKYFINDITIFQVMDSLWRKQELTKSQYCWYVKRRVFNSLEATYREIPFRDAETWHRHQNQADEYRMRFSTWGKLVDHSQEMENA